MSVVVWGVCGAGKTSVARQVAQRLGPGWVFVDADDFHEPEMVAKMVSGRPLSDTDRRGWLERCAATLAKGGVVLACSALKEVYREMLAFPPEPAPV